MLDEFHAQKKDFDSALSNESQLQPKQVRGLDPRGTPRSCSSSWKSSAPVLVVQGVALILNENKETAFFSTFLWGLSTVSNLIDFEKLKFLVGALLSAEALHFGMQKFPRALVKAKRQKSETTDSKNIRHNVFFVSMALAVCKLLWSRISSKLQVIKEKSLWMS